MAQTRYALHVPKQTPSGSDVQYLCDIQSGAGYLTHTHTQTHIHLQRGHTRMNTVTVLPYVL